jgi:serine/threonine-protein kinase
MNPEQQTRLKRLFLGAYTLPPHERAAYLGSACPDDPDLRREVDSLLASHDEAEARGFLDSPQIGIDQLALPEDEEPIQQIGPYRIHHELGRGGMGVVYLAEREDVGKRVAIKVVHRYLASSDVVARFLFERRILARLEHPHIARLLDAGTMEDGTPFLAMEYVEGEPLIAYCDDRRMSLPGRLALFEKVCEAVRYAHQNLIIHRDLKPSNILVHEGEGTPQVKLLDFGIAKLVEQEAESPALTRAGRDHVLRLCRRASPTDRRSSNRRDRRRDLRPHESSRCGLLGSSRADRCG